MKCTLVVGHSLDSAGRSVKIAHLHLPRMLCFPLQKIPKHAKREMTELDQSPKHSPLAQSVTRDGKTVSVEIYEDGEGCWLLEVVDEYGNSSVWDSAFATDQEALDEALKTIAEDGIHSLIGLHEDGLNAGELEHSLSDTEIDELDDFLAGEAIEETSMDVSTLEGFLTAIVIGPRTVLPSEWLPWIWDMYEAEAGPQFANETQANTIMSLIMRHYNAVIHTFTADPTSFEPIFWRGSQWGAAEWCEGFLLGLQFCDEEWSALAIGQPTWFTPFLRLGTEDGIKITSKDGSAEKWMDEIEPSLVRIHAYWDEIRSSEPDEPIGDDFHFGDRKEIVQVVRDGPKIGRNDPCPCGSGKKFKKCCGGDGVPSKLH